MRIGQISNSCELDIWLKGIIKHYSYPGMPPQFQALRVPVKQSWEVRTVLAPYKPFSSWWCLATTAVADEVNDLIETLKDENWVVREEAVRALERIS